MTPATKPAARKLRIRYERMLSRTFHLYWRVSRGMTLGVRGVVRNPSGHVFLIKHSYISGWHLPGGGVEPKETLHEALARELREEGNIEVLGMPRLHGMFFNAHVSNRDHVAVYIVDAFRRHDGPIDDREIIDCGFFPGDALPPDTARGTRARLAEILSGAPPSTTW